MVLTLALITARRSELVDAFRSIVTLPPATAVWTISTLMRTRCRTTDTRHCPILTWWSAPAEKCALSNFLLWQLAYAEIYVTPPCGPSSAECTFGRHREYQKSERRYGGLAYHPTHIPRPSPTSTQDGPELERLATTETILTAVLLIPIVLLLGAAGAGGRCSFGDGVVALLAVQNC